jgi:dTDP-4-dehydrorhamnose 3,5-epimerase
MIFEKTKLPGVYLIDTEPVEDDLGLSTQIFFREAFLSQGLHADWVQCGLSFCKKRGTLHGLHYQAAPYKDAKLIYCIRGAAYNVIIDLRKDAPTFMQSIAIALTGDSHRMLYIPEQFAHGFQARMDYTELFYQVSEPYSPEYARGIRWNDPAFKIRWPIQEVIISDQDRSFPPWSVHSL